MTPNMDSATRELTHEQYLASRRDECRTSGHSFAEIVVIGSMAPSRVMCSCCGASWRVHPDDVGRAFGEGA